MQDHPRTSSSPTIILAGERIKNTAGAAGFMSALENLTRNLPLLEIEDKWEAAIAARRMYDFFDQLNNRLATRKAKNRNDHLSDADLLVRIEDSSLPRDAYTTLMQARQEMFAAMQKACPQITGLYERAFSPKQEVTSELYKQVPDAAKNMVAVMTCLNFVLDTTRKHFSMISTPSSDVTRYT